MLEDIEKNLEELKQALKSLENLPPDKVYITDFKTVYKFEKIIDKDCDSEGWYINLLVTDETGNKNNLFHSSGNFRQFLTKREAQKIALENEIQSWEYTFNFAAQKLEQSKQKLKGLENERI